MLRGILLIKFNLRNKGIDIEPGCVVCNAVEDDMHVFIHCPLAQECWHRVGHHSGAHSFSSRHELLSYFFNFLDDWAMGEACV